MSKKLKELEEYIENENRIGDLQYCHYSLIIDYINDICEDFEEIKKENIRLKKQLANNHHTECNCSFCKPVNEA